jgi:hypothetical protein
MMSAWKPWGQEQCGQQKKGRAHASDGSASLMPLDQAQSAGVAAAAAVSSVGMARRCADAKGIQATRLVWTSSPA